MVIGVDADVKLFSSGWFSSLIEENTVKSTFPLSLSEIFSNGTYESPIFWESCVGTNLELGQTQFCENCYLQDHLFIQTMFLGLHWITKSVWKKSQVWSQWQYVEYVHHCFTLPPLLKEE